MVEGVEAPECDGCHQLSIDPRLPKIPKALENQKKNKAGHDLFADRPAYLDKKETQSTSTPSHPQQTRLDFGANSASHRSQIARTQQPAGRINPAARTKPELLH